MSAQQAKVASRTEISLAGHSAGPACGKAGGIPAGAAELGGQADAPGMAAEPLPQPGGAGRRRLREGRMSHNAELSDIQKGG